jgi:hypothetical protein
LGEREPSADARPFGAGKREISQPDSAGVSQVLLPFNRTGRDVKKSITLPFGKVMLFVTLIIRLIVFWIFTLRSGTP